MKSASGFTRLMVIALGLTFSASGLASTPRVHHYQVSIDPQLNEAKVSICFSGAAPEYLVVDFRDATQKLLDFPQTKQGFIEYQGRYWKTADLKPDACLHYRADISAHKVKSPQHSERALSYQSDNTWLWLPEKFAADERADIRFDLPDGYQVSAPWTPLDDSGRWFRIGDAPHDWGFTLLVGQFDNRHLTLRGGQVNVALLGSLKQSDALVDWIASNAKTLGRYLGHFPVENVQVIMLENKRFKNGPVPWGEVDRGGGLAIRFVVNSSLPIDQFYGDWTATHEFSHLLLPHVISQDSWMSEGFASYLQYLLMVEAGSIDERTAWQKLYEGLQRGEKGTQQYPNEKLRETFHNRRQAKGWDSARTMRIYWSGAAYFLIADWQLRALSHNQRGLRDVLQALNACCNQQSREWSGEQLATQLDQLANTQLFLPLFKQLAESYTFPDYAPAFEALGLSLQNGQIVLQERGSDLRRAIIHNPSSY